MKSITKPTAKTTKTVPSDNRSWNCGVEGPTNDPEICKLRAHQMRNILATLLLSVGTPMILAATNLAVPSKQQRLLSGQYEISWVNWKTATKGHALIEFVQQLTKIRRQYPILRRNRFLTGVYNEELGIKDVTWIHPSGDEMQEQHWKTDRCFGMLIDGRAQPTGLRRRPVRTPPS